MYKATKVPQKILVVDDEEDIVSLLRHHLTGAGYEVAYAFDAITALSIATREPIDLIVSDIRRARARRRGRQWRGVSR